MSASTAENTDWGVDLVWRFFDRYQLNVKALSARSG
jgi:hypothetical protein